MELVDLASWPRRELFEFFSPLSNPFYSVTFRLDVTKLHAYTKARGLSFYYALVYLSTLAVNRVEAFSYSMEDGRVVRLRERLPSFTDLKPGQEQFHIVTMPCRGSLEDFCAAAKAKSRSQQGFIDYASEGADLIYLSCLPWVDLTGLTNERDMDPDDAVPRLAWGRYVPENGREILGYSVEVNHRCIDGVHVGQFAQKLEALIEELDSAE